MIHSLGNNYAVFKWLRKMRLSGSLTSWIIWQQKHSWSGLHISKGKNSLPTWNTIYGKTHIFSRCVSKEERHDIFMHYHSGLIGGYYSGNRIGKNALDAVFYWPTMFQDAQTLVWHCAKCQRAGNISKREEMPQHGTNLAKYLMCGESISWACSLAPRAKSSFWWLSTTFPSGWRHKLLRPMM